MKTVTQRALVVISERIKPFSPRLEALSIKLDNCVRWIVQLARSLPDIAICHEAKEGKVDARPQTPKDRSRTRWNTVKIFQGREQRRYLAIGRLSRKVSVGLEVTWFSSPCPGGLNTKRSVAWVCGLDYFSATIIFRQMPLNRAQRGSRPAPFHPISSRWYVFSIPSLGNIC